MESQLTPPTTDGIDQIFFRALDGLDQVRTVLQAHQGHLRYGDGNLNPTLTNREALVVGARLGILIETLKRTHKDLYQADLQHVLALLKKAEA